ncbi:EAL domain-containing protein [Anaerotignum lactatifermentans]|uniref:EAL domain-containing protein n=1 Tax=Anaerotignum lactatifermentans TaxID=160404 RepID=A0ABS2GB67_9FIRM|nr:EAL domain-containing protein [Anaerotignum lactatifermentans]MBM6830191.1 EAL domain-containing protein [Anaerotignum lactatifermentans]MBM6878736.1 EAL domain-containing protein [Anaerotignum lactatifermentans]MBM6951800.1 EAL domain-containing protein [Anaerotignum lactatifermentans]
MDEKSLKKRLIKITLITIIGSVLLTLVGVGLIAYAGKAAESSDHTQMVAETQDYRDRIFKQMNKNLQILSTLSKVFDVTEIAQSHEKIKEIITEANAANDFVSLLFIQNDGYMVLSSIKRGTMEDLTLGDLSEYSVDAINRAFQGESVASKVFDSKFYDEKIFVYAMPVYKDDEIIGVLAAGDTIEIFTDIANGENVMDGSGYIHIINTKGEFLVRSENSIIKDQFETILDCSFISDQTKNEMRYALENGETMFGSFSYGGSEYHFYLEPMNLNGWYLYCANEVWGSTLSTGNILIIISGILFLLLILYNALLFVGYYQIRKSSKRLLQIAYWDQLTGAENVMKFDYEYQEMIRTRKDYCTVALNIHNFKSVNDLFGKDQGDRVLCYLKRIIETNLKEGEFFCRSSGDTFFLLLFEVDEKVILERIGKIISDVRNASVLHGDFSYELSLYSGAAVRGDREKTLVAMQSIKNAHQKDVVFYNQEIHEIIRRKNSIESYMHLALKNREFKLFLQPKYSLKDNTLVGAEALVRWQNPDGSYRYPNEFIPLFEKNGFCLKLDMYMVEKACAQIREWMDAGIEPIGISVNQSKLLFSDRNYPNNLEQIVKKYGVPASLITLEILEGVAENDMNLLNQQINALHEKGFKVSMDDFGSGYSSLNMLYQLKIDELKLDRGFMRKVTDGDDERRRVILSQIIQFAKTLGISTVAEGIETEEDKNNMTHLACDYGQGYYFEKPIKAKEFSRIYMSSPAR